MISVTLISALSTRLPCSVFWSLGSTLSFAANWPWTSLVLGLLLAPFWFKVLVSWWWFVWQFYFRWFCQVVRSGNMRHLFIMFWWCYSDHVGVGWVLFSDVLSFDRLNSLWFNMAVLSMSHWSIEQIHTISTGYPAPLRLPWISERQKQHDLPKSVFF